MTDATVKLNHNDFGKLAWETLSKDLSLRFQAHGQSMIPTIQDGDIITIIPLGKRKLKIGDIVLHRISRTGNLATHRIIRITSLRSSKAIHTRGDAFGCTTDFVSVKDILGLATNIEHNGLIRSIDNAGERIKGRLLILSQNLRIFNKALSKHSHRLST